MKKFIVLLLIVSLTASSWAQSGLGPDDSFDDWWMYAGLDEEHPEAALPDDNACPEPSPVPAADEIFKSKCISKMYGIWGLELRTKNGQRDQRCKCLRKEGEENFLINELSKDKRVIKEQLDKMKAHYSMRFQKAYAQMTLEAATQEKLLGILPAEGKKVGCDPQTLQDSVEESKNAHVANKEKLLNKVYTAKSAELRKCKGSCESLKAEVGDLERELTDLRKEHNVESQCGSLGITYLKEGLKQELQAAIDYYNNHKDKGLKWKSSYKTLENALKNINENDFDEKNCSMETINISNALKIYEENRQADGGEYVPSKENQCETKDGLCNAFNRINTTLENKQLERFHHDKPTQCISYGDYKTFKGMPEQVFLDELADEKDKNVGDLLDTPKRADTTLKAAQLKFLRANPVIARIAQGGEEERKKLGLALKEFAKKSKDLTPQQKFSAYIDFMQNDIKELAENKNTQAYICKSLAQSYTAIQVADTLPRPEHIGTDKDNMSTLIETINDCNISNHNKKSVTGDLQKTLELNSIFMLAPKDPEAEEKKDKQDYQKFLSDYCQGYAEHIAKNCKSDITDQCRQDFLDKSGFKAQNKTLRLKNIKDALSKKDIQEIAKVNDTNEQDRPFLNWWNENVGSKMSKNPIPLKGQEKEYKAAQQSNQKIIDNVEIPPQFQSPSSNSYAPSMANSTVAPSAAPTSSDAAAGGAASDNNGSTVNPGQVIPQFSNTPAVTPAPSPSTTPVLDPNILEQGKPAKEAITNFDSLTPEQQRNGLENAEDYMKESGWDEEKISESGVREALAEATQKIEEKIKQVEELDKPARSPASTRTSFRPSTAVQYAPVTAAPSIDAPTSNTTAGKANGLSKTSRNSSAVNDALISIYENSKVHVKGGVVDPAEFRGKQKSDKDLEVNDAQKFQLLTSNSDELEAYVKKELKGVSVGNSKIITITNTASTANPLPQVIYRVSQNKDGSFSIQSVPGTIPVEWTDEKIERTATLRNLHLNLKR